jgi:hypothetical protein
VTRHLQLAEQGFMLQQMRHCARVWDEPEGGVINTPSLTECVTTAAE